MQMLDLVFKVQLFTKHIQGHDSSIFIMTNLEAFLQKSHTINKERAEI